MVHLGGMPHGASAVMGAPVINLMPHVMDQDDIDAFVREYGASARLSLDGRADGVRGPPQPRRHPRVVPVPAHHQRTDRSGVPGEPLPVRRGDAAGDRDEVGTAMTVGVRLNIREEVPGGYDIAGGVEIAQYLESTGLIDYVHGVVGSPWGNPSYIQPTYFDPAQWSALAASSRPALIPVVHTGRINGPDVAERVLAAGHADIVGMARAHIAEGRILQKAREGRATEIRRVSAGTSASAAGTSRAGLRLRGEPAHQPRGRGALAAGSRALEPARCGWQPGRHGARRTHPRVRVRRVALGG